MLIVIPIPAIISGFLATLLYYAVLKGAIYGVTAPMLPLFVMAAVGMMYGRAGITTAVTTASILSFALLPAKASFLLIATQYVPLALFIRQCMIATISVSTKKVTWASASDAMSIVAMYGAVFYGAMIITDSALYQFVTELILADVKASFSEIDPSIAANMEAAVRNMPHMIIAIGYCASTVLLYVLTVIAHMVTDTFRKAKRPAIQLTVNSPPNMLLVAFGVSALMGLTGVESIVQAGRAASVILLLPYLFSGLGAVHKQIRSWQGGGFWLGAFYMFVVMMWWPLLIVTMLGLLKHIGQCTSVSSRS